MKRCLCLLTVWTLLFSITAYRAAAEDMNMTNAEKIVYGQSVLGRELVCWRVGEENAEKSVLMVFAIHGFEDEFAADGALLCRIAEDTVRAYAAEPERLNGFALFVVPCANPDGLAEGVTNRGFGRCNANGYDINRDFPVDFEKEQEISGHVTGKNPFTTPEAAALRDLVNEIRPTYAVDVHGYVETVYFGRNETKEIAHVFAAPFGFQIRRWSSGGMLSAWLDTVTQGALLIELRTPLREQSRNGGDPNVLWKPLDAYVADQGGKLRRGLEDWLRLCGK